MFSIDKPFLFRSSLTRPPVVYNAMSTLKMLDKVNYLLLSLLYEPDYGFCVPFYSAKFLSNPNLQKTCSCCPDFNKAHVKKQDNSQVLLKELLTKTIDSH